jgi:hypothetical protein
MSDKPDRPNAPEIREREGFHFHAVGFHLAPNVSGDAAGRRIVAQLLERLNPRGLQDSAHRGVDEYIVLISDPRLVGLDIHHAIAYYASADGTLVILRCDCLRLEAYRSDEYVLWNYFLEERPLPVQPAFELPVEFPKPKDARILVTDDYREWGKVFAELQHQVK